jgi:hypothetical protein
MAALASPQSRRLLPQVKRIGDIARTSPFTGRDCNVATPYYTSPGGKEGEPYIAVNPVNPANRIAVWMDAARATDNTAFTTDGGLTWTLSIPRGIDECTGNRTRPWEASGDPWISFGPDGVAYLSTLTWAHFATPPFTEYVSVVHVQTSHNGGRTWSAPVLLSAANSVSDKPMVVADPSHPGIAYEIWRNQGFGLPVGRRGVTRLYFAFTHNGGESWSSPITIGRGELSDFFGNPQLSVLHDGTLVATSSLAAATGGANQLAWHSHDGGRSWQGPVVIRQAAPGSLAAMCGQTTAGGDTSAASGQQTVVNGRSVVIVTNTGAAAASGAGELVMSRSDDGGATWHSWTILRSSLPVILASVSAGRHGLLGLVWDEIDTPAINCSGPTIPVRSLFAASSDAGLRWSEPVGLGAAAWNLASGLRGTGGFSGYFVGDYQALAPTPGGFTTATVQGQPVVAGAPPVDGNTGVMIGNVDVRLPR